MSGYFDSRQGVWEEPIYRNVFGLLRRVWRCGNRQPDRPARPDCRIQRRAQRRRPAAAPAKAGKGTPDYNSVEPSSSGRARWSSGARAKRLRRPTSSAATKAWPPGRARTALSTALLKRLGSSRRQVEQGPRQAPANLREPCDPAAPAATAGQGAGGLHAGIGASQSRRAPSFLERSQGRFGAHRNGKPRACLSKTYSGRRCSAACRPLPSPPIRAHAAGGPPGRRPGRGAALDRL